MGRLRSTVHRSAESFGWTWVFLVASIFPAMVLTPGLSYSEIYHYVDSRGTLHFSNVPTDSRFQRLRKGAPVVPIDSREIQKLIREGARRYGLDPELIKAVIRVESNYDPSAVSVAGAMGLMQLMPETALGLGVENAFNPSENILGGTKLLSRLLDRFNGDLTLTLAAYHAGAKRVEEHGGVPPIPQTRRYIRKVLSAYKVYRNKEQTTGTTYKVHSGNDTVIYTNVPEQYQDSRRDRVFY